MDVLAPLIADRQPPNLIQPGHGPLDHPAVAAKPLAALDAFAGDAPLNVAAAQEATAARDVVGLVRMQLGGAHPPLAGGLLDRRNGVDQGFERDRIVAVGAGQADGERRAPPVDHKLAFRARFAAIRRVGPGCGAPLFAGMLALSRQARLQSIWSAAPRRSSSAW